MGIFFSEIWDTDHDLVAGNQVGEDIAQAIGLADALRGGADQARQAKAALRQSLTGLFERVELLALPTMPVFPPRLDSVNAESLFPLCVEITSHVAPFNAAGNPCTAQPVPVPGSRLPASLQLVGPANGEDLLVATAAHIEAALPA